MQDKSIWQTIGGKKFCSYKSKTQFDTFCKNKNNVSGLCTEHSCPLSNSFYATVREENDILFLYIKTPERIHEPVNMYEKIELSKEYNEALKMIEERLANFDPFLVHKCKQRLTKLTQYLERKKSIREKIIVTAVCKGKNRLEKLRSKKALNKVKFEKNMEEELYERLKEGVFGKEMKEKHERKVSYLFEESDDSEIIKKKEKKKEVLEW